MSAIDMATLGVFAFVLFLQMIWGIISFLSKFDSPIGFEEVADGEPPIPLAYSRGKISGLRGGGRGILWPLYTKKYDNDVRIYATPWKGVFTRLRPHSKEFKAIRLLVRQVSLLSLAVMGIIRFAMGEPILSLF